MRCFTSAHPKRWYRFLSWAELSYNTSYHTATKVTPFELVYGREPPALLQYEMGSTTNGSLEESLKERDALLSQIKDHLVRAQDVMKNNADKSRRDLQFEVGQLVFLKLRPYRQSTVARRFCQKLAAKYYGPFKVLDRVGKVAYKLQLPESSRIHSVFHVSQLKPVIGKNHEVTDLPTSLSYDDEFVIEPDDIIDTRYDEEGRWEVLITWKGLPAHENTWMLVRELKHQFPHYQFEGKLNSGGGGVLLCLGGFIQGE